MGHSSRGSIEVQHVPTRFAAQQLRGTLRLGLFYEKFDAQLDNNEFVAGSYFSVADITTLCAVDFASFSKLGIPKHCKNLIRWYGAVSQRSSVSVR